MGSYTLINEIISLQTLNVAERLEVLDSMQGLLLAAKDSSSSGSEPGQPSVQAETGGVEALGVSEEQMTKLADYVAIFTSATYQTRRNSQTDELAAVDAERCRIVKYMVEKSLNYKNLPLAEEQAAGKALTVELAPYDKFYERPVAERTRIIDGFLEDARKEKYAEHIATLGFGVYLEKAEELNNRYKACAIPRIRRRARQSILQTSPRRCRTWWTTSARWPTLGAWLIRAMPPRRSSPKQIPSSTVFVRRERDAVAKRTRATMPASRTTRTSRRPSNPTPKPPTPSSRIPKSRRRPIPRRRGQGRRHRRSRMIGRWCSESWGLKPRIKNKSRCPGVETPG